jgi:hypothetical protein
MALAPLSLTSLSKRSISARDLIPGLNASTQ